MCTGDTTGFVTIGAEAAGVPTAEAGADADATDGTLAGTGVLAGAGWATGASTGAATGTLGCRCA